MSANQTAKFKLPVPVALCALVFYGFIMSLGALLFVGVHPILSASMIADNLVHSEIRPQLVGGAVTVVFEIIGLLLTGNSLRKGAIK